MDAGIMYQLTDAFTAIIQMTATIRKRMPAANMIMGFLFLIR